MRSLLLLATALVAMALPTAASAATVPYDTPEPTQTNPLVPFPTPPNPGPTVSGTSQAGGALTGTRGSWPNATVTSEWLRCDVGASTCETTGDTDLRYSPTAADVGLQIKLRVVGRRTQAVPPGSSTRTVDAASGTIAAAPAAGAAPRNLSAPRITGQPRVGQTLRVNLGQWTGTDPINYTASWASCLGGGCRQVATGGAYTLGATDVGRTVVLTVSALNGFGAAQATASVKVTGATAGLARLSPFPTLLVDGRVAGSVTRISTLRLRRVPGGALISTSCSGRGCPYRASRVRVRPGGSRTVTLRRLQRRMRAGATVVITVRKGQTLGKYIRLRFRRSSAPARVDRCVAPTSSTPQKCP